ncbi:MAG: chemotaxis protein CheA [Verrucomicrobiota bacterium]
MTTTNYMEVSCRIEKLAMEMVFTQPGKDDGLLPINSLLSEIEDSFSTQPVPEPIAQAVGLARKWVDAALEEGFFSTDCLARLSTWNQWMQRALQTSAELPLPPFPPIFTVVASTQVPNPAPETLPSVEPLPVSLDLAENADLLREFIGEAREHLQEIEMGVLSLEDKPKDEHTLHSIFRGFHSLKGGSGFLNLGPMNRLAHELESLLELARQHKLDITSDHIDVILAGADALKKFMAAVERQVEGSEPPHPISMPIAALVARITDVVQGGSGEPDQESGSATSSSSQITPETNSELPSPEPHPEKRNDAAAEQEAAEQRSIRGSVKVDTGKLDSLIDLVGEMVVAQAQVLEDPALAKLESQQLARNLSHLRRISNDLQRISMSLRMVPIRSTFHKMTRLVRDLSAKAGKLVELRLSGEETELDRNIIEELSDPLVHMIRNSVDHGIEKPEVRVARGKPARGEIRLRARHEGGNVVIEITDDGAGINAERVLAKARERGIIEPNAELTEKEIFALLFAPGFSTAESITDISGRGVGMDVVKRNVDKLRGKIEIESVPQRGSTFTIYLPLTLAIIDGLLVSVGRERFILPTLSVRESFRPTADMISSVCGRGEMVTVRGQIRPLLRLHQYFNLQPDTTDPTQAIVIVVQSEGQDRCLLVDRLLAKQEVVIKGLGETFKNSRGLTGAAILGDGRVGLILDVNSLVALKDSASLQE